MKIAYELFNLPTVLFFSPSITINKQARNRQKSNKNSPKVDLVGMNDPLTYLIHTAAKGPLDLFSFIAHIRLAWLNEL